MSLQERSKKRTVSKNFTNVTKHSFPRTITIKPRIMTEERAAQSRLVNRPDYSPLPLREVTNHRVPNRKRWSRRLTPRVLKMCSWSWDSNFRLKDSIAIKSRTTSLSPIKVSHQFQSRNWEICLNSMGSLIRKQNYSLVILLSPEIKRGKSNTTKKELPHKGLWLLISRKV